MRFLIPRGLVARSLPALLVLLAALAGPPSAPGQQSVEVEIAYPPDRTLVETEDITVEGYVRTSGIDGVEIVVNKGWPVRAVLNDTFFSEAVSLDEGLNTVQVGSVVRRVWRVSPAAQPPKEYRRVYGHFGLSDGCLECHKLDPSGKIVLSSERDEVCTWCHGDVIRGRLGVPFASVHSPVRDGKCLGCHVPHLSEKKGLPAEKPPQCPECHTAVMDRMKTDRFVHGPMNLGDCRLCHAVHASTEPRLLVRPATTLCTDCHSDALPPVGTPAELQPHTMIPEGRCGRCHEPHSSENLRMLRQPAGLLCQGCHEGKTRSFHEAKGFSIYVCAKCHDLHRPTQPHLIIDASRSLCTECHDVRGKMVFTHSFVAEGKCFLCHSFHEAPLTGDIAGLCLGCHRDNPQLPGAHRGIAIERARCTNCHLPHQASRRNLLRPVEHPPFEERACERCHRDRAAKIGPVYRPLCIECHQDKDLAREAPAVVHPPFRDADCSSCHRSHNAEAEYLLTEPEGPLCLGCHRKMRKAMLLTPVSAHTAVLEGRCGSCHDAHVSPNASLLRKPAVELCPSCHAALVRSPGGGAWPVPHKPVAESKCRLCHRHHTSPNPALLKAPPPQSCRPCHTEFFATIGGAGLRSRHEPVKEGNCGACHQLHGGEAAVLLKEGARGAVCRGCHKGVTGTHHSLSLEELASKDGGAEAAARGCTHCHRPHASRERKLLFALGDHVCKGCHKV